MQETSRLGPETTIKFFQNQAARKGDRLSHGIETLRAGGFDCFADEPVTSQWLNHFMSEDVLLYYQRATQLSDLVGLVDEDSLFPKESRVIK